MLPNPISTDFRLNGIFSIAFRIMIICSRSVISAHGGGPCPWSNHHTPQFRGRRNKKRIFQHTHIPHTAPHKHARIISTGSRIVLVVCHFGYKTIIYVTPLPATLCIFVYSAPNRIPNRCRERKKRRMDTSQHRVFMCDNAVYSSGIQSAIGWDLAAGQTNDTLCFCVLIFRSRRTADRR